MRRSIVAMATATAVVVACAPETECAGYCGTVVVINSSDPSTAFPPAIRTSDEQPVVEQLYVRLAELGPELQTAGDSGFIPELASRWTREDDVTLVFALNPDARWHDGVPVTAADVVFTYEMYRHPDVGSTNAVLLDRIASVTARDDHTVVFRYELPYLEQLFDATYYMHIIPKHVLDTIAPGEIATHPIMTRQPIGGGPYRIARWDDDGTIELVADTTFFLGRPGLRRVIFRTVGDFGARITALASGDGDFLEFLGGAPTIQRIEQSSEARVVPYASRVYNYLGFNFRAPDDTSRAHPLFGDQRVRQALAKVIDRAGINETVNGEYGTAAHSPLPPMLRVSNLDFPVHSKDLAEARALLEDAGWTDTDGDGILDRHGEPFAFDVAYPSTSGMRQSTAIALEEAFRQAGLRSEVDAVDIAAFSERLRNGAFDTFIQSLWTSPTPGSIKTAWTTGATLNFGRYSNPDFDASLQRLLNARDPEAERQALLDAMRLLHEDVPALWLYYVGMHAGVHTRIDNVSLRPDSWAVTLWQWRVRDGEWEPRDLIGN